ncbi:transcription factor [Rhodotorula toruloides]|uniref:Transcription factor n=1 Tax=Rhodotorula toruloides TaxID=5286 RepID=A0A511KR31_RHOTO|nr:transcription factor [Rhodotorula toruloides]
MDSWTQPDFLQTSGQDYLASLASFLDGKGDISVPPSHILGPNNQQELSSPELTDSASPASSTGLDSTATANVMQSRQHNQQHSRTTQQAHPHPDKRKNGTQGAGAIKDSRRVSGGHHSHPTGEDGEISRSESPEDDSSRGGSSKGNKTKTSEKRRAQNRQAQRNFRERKEKHLKDLEERVKLLEQQTNERDAENAALKQLLESLRSENDRLKVYESAFTFDYNKDVDGSSAMPQAATFQPPPSLPPTSAPSPASSLGSSVSPVDDLNASTTPFKFDTSGILSSSAAGPSLTLPSSTSTPPAASTVPTTTAQQFDDFLSSFVASPSPGASGSSISSLPTPPSATASGSGDLFTAYRDPLASLGMPPTSLSTFNDFDNLFSSIPPPPGAAAASTISREEPLIAQFINASPSPPSNAAGATFPSPGAAFFTGNLAPKSPSSLDPSSDQCTEGIKARMAAAVTPGGKFEFDLDGLCSEMKAKATCQEAARRALMSAMAEDAAASRQAYPQQL